MSTTISNAATQAATAGARAVPDFLAEPLAKYVEDTAQLTDMLIGPLRRILEEQQRLAEQMAEWSETQRQLSEQIAAWGAQYQQLTEQMHQLVRPALEQSDRLSEATKAFVEDLRH